MLFDDDFVLSLSSLDPQDAILKVIDTYLSINKETTITKEETLETRDLLVTIYTHHGIEFLESLKQDDDHSREFNNVFRYIKSQIIASKAKSRSDYNKERFALLLGKQFHYSLSYANISRIQQIINELRNLITGNTKLEDDHRRRLLRRLERLQGELHKRISDLDHFYGLVGDAGVLLRKLGEDAKPFVDRVREIARIVWRSQADAEQLPSSSEPAFQIEEQSESPE